MLYATDGIDSESDLAKPMVGVANVWYEGNPCNKHVLGLVRESRNLFKKLVLLVTNSERSESQTVSRWEHLE